MSKKLFKSSKDTVSEKELFTIAANKVLERIAGRAYNEEEVIKQIETIYKTLKKVKV